MELRNQDEYKHFLEKVLKKKSIDEAFKTAADLLVTKDLRIRNLQQAVLLLKDCPCPENKD